jgi:hypothetical protein
MFVTPSLASEPSILYEWNGSGSGRDDSTGLLQQQLLILNFPKILCDVYIRVFSRSTEHESKFPFP